jgi:hypothetical protein
LYAVDAVRPAIDAVYRHRYRLQVLTTFVFVALIVAASGALAAAARME